MVNIKVAVRIRPLSRRELLLGEEVIVRKENKSVLVTNPKIPERQDGDSRQRTRRFAVDFCYDPSDPEGCCQEAVYKEIGSEVLYSMFEGYNACVLAYGHSASGKTYTIMGMQNDPGLTPRLCHGLFEKLDERCLNGRIQFQITVSFLEIYNEKVRDLLGSEETIGTFGSFTLRVREHPKLGPYVQGLSEHLVTNEKKLLELLTTGNRRRSTAATEKNIHSSRSHAVFTIQFKQFDGENFETEKSSRVHLVDLAGSERASPSQSKERLKEGANINKSLVTLGNVVSALAESCETGNFLKVQPSSKSWHPFVPYRDSVLTWLLKDTLGGNSNTIMIATISPASSCLNETVNTLRYAKRTKRIVNHPIVNEDPKIRTIRQLKEEIVKLKRLLVSFQSNEEEDNHHKTKNQGKPFTRDEEEGLESVNEIKAYESDEKSKNFDDLESSSMNDCEGSVLGQGAALSKSSACKISDEKKSDVNGSVNDSSSHETEFFSDSLKTFSPAYLQSGSSCEAADDGSRRLETTNNLCKIREISADKFNPCLIRDFNFYENQSKKKASTMTHRNRPDLIRGISPQFGETLLSGSSQSCTDVSNLSQSTSENSLNSSGSADAPFLEKRLSHNRAAKNLILQETEPERGRNIGRKKRNRNEVPQLSEKKSEKRSEIVEAVTTRLYVTKRKVDHRGVISKQEAEEEGELEELKLGRRARMKLFDLSRKLAMARKIKRTVDNDTQTDNMTATIRVKEKCVTTDPKEVSDFEKTGTLIGNTNVEKPCVIMNQVFIPRASNYVVECGKVVRIESPEAVGKHESATQTAFESQAHKSANTSPIKFNFRDEDYFSEDSLDLEDKSSPCEQLITDDQEKVDSESKMSFDSEKGFRENSKAQNFTENKKSKEKFFKLWPVNFLSEETIIQNEDAGILLLDESSSEEWNNEENLSSENSFSSVDESDISCETSSEDFVFYESPIDKDSLPKAKPTGNRELYTITENSEQSDPSDAVGSVQSQNPLNAPQESEPERLGDSPQGGRAQKEIEKELKVHDRLIEKKEDEIKEELFKSNHACIKNTTERKNSAKESNRLYTSFIQIFNPKKVFSENLEMPKQSSSLKTGTTSKSPDQVPRVAGNPTAKNQTKIKNSKPESSGHRLRGDKTDYQTNSQKQYLNLNIPSGSNTSASAFSVDTHLFEKALRKDQNADAMFNSTDSITFVFMGPAKPKTPVLMEIIRRSLGKTLLPRNETSSAQRLSRSRGTQGDANLMRSVSVDSAMIALSRIAKNQDSCEDLRRTTSLRALSPNETPTVLGRRENSFQLDLKGKNAKDEKTKSENKNSIAATTNPTETIKSKKTEESEKCKKSVSWSGEAKHEVSLELGAPGFDLHCRYVRDPETEDSNEENPHRRVRFSKPEPRNLEEMDASLGQAPKPVESADPLKAFLREATQLLKNINFCSSKCPDSFSETGKKSIAEANQKIGGLSSLKTSDLRTGRSETEGCFQEDVSWRAKTGKLKANNLTWPKRRAAAAGKPPTGMKPTFPASLLPSRSISLHFNGFSDPTRNCSQTNRMESSGQSWNLSNLSMPSGNDQSKSSSSQLSCCSESLRPKRIFHSSLPATYPRYNVPKLNFNSILKLEADIEESCRHLEMAAEKDRMRERISVGQETNSEWFSPEVGLCYGNDPPSAEKMEVRETIKRRKPEICAGGCTCRVSIVDPCKYQWLKGCRSSFELDSFGPGSTHCHQLCMFCRKKDAEIYYSALSLNSECSSDLCRLNYYGFCPCSSVRLNHVTSSPRAYMQRLLALRRRIVSQTKRKQLKISNSLVDEEALNFPY